MIDPGARGAAAAALRKAAFALDAVSAGGRIGVIGDSFIQQGIGTDANGAYKTPAAWPIWLEAISMGQFTFNVANDYGVNGETSAQALARCNSVLLANQNVIDVFGVDTCRNDPDTTKANGDASISNCVQMLNMARDVYGKLPVLALPNAPRTHGPLSANQWAVREYVNRELARYCANNNIPFIDYWSYVADLTYSNGRGIVVAYTGDAQADSLHYNTLGCYHIGKVAMDDLAKYTAPLTFNHAAEVFDATLNPYGNMASLCGATVPFMSGTAGTITGGKGITGQLQTSMVIDRYGGDAAMALAVTAPPATAGYGALGSGKLAMAITGAAAASNWEIFGGFNTPTGMGGKQVVFQLQTTCTSLAAPADLRMSLYLRGVGGLWGEALAYPYMETNKPFLIRTAPATLVADGNFNQFAIAPSALAAKSGTIEISNFAILPYRA